MKLKIVEVNGKRYAEVTDDGKPVYTDNDGKDVGFDAPATVAKIAGLNREAQTNREAREAAETKLKAFEGFEGIEDPAAARAALETVKSLKGGELKTAQQVEEIKAEAKRNAEQQVADTARQSATKIKELEDGLAARTSELYQEKVGGAFSRSGYVKEKLAVPADMVQNTFGKQFKVENGAIVPYGMDGNKLYSRKPERAGELADFDEGLELLVESYPHRASILRGTGHSGGGSQNGGGGGGTGKNGRPSMTRQAFEALPPLQKSQTVRTHDIVDAAA